MRSIFLLETLVAHGRSSACTLKSSLVRYCKCKMWIGFVYCCITLWALESSVFYFILLGSDKGQKKTNFSFNTVSRHIWWPLWSTWEHQGAIDIWKCLPSCWQVQWKHHRFDERTDRRIVVQHADLVEKLKNMIGNWSMMTCSKFHNLILAFLFQASSKAFSNATKCLI